MDKTFKAMLIAVACEMFLTKQKRRVIVDEYGAGQMETEWKVVNFHGFEGVVFKAEVVYKSCTGEVEFILNPAEAQNTFEQLSVGEELTVRRVRKKPIGLEISDPEVPEEILDRIYDQFSEFLRSNPGPGPDAECDSDSGIFNPGDNSDEEGEEWKKG